MTHVALLLLLIVGMNFPAQPALAGPAPDPGLAPLKFLVGKWRGTAQDGKVFRASYRFTSGGTSLTETLVSEKEPAMTTMYHLDGKHLMLTHYCSLNNQPRMRAGEYKDGDKTLTFSFVDATNLASPSDMHMHQVTFEFNDRNHFTQSWVAMKDGKEMPPHVFQFKRVK